MTKKPLKTRLFHWWHARGRCSHRSHILKLYCWRPWNWQYRCDKHNRDCVGRGIPCDQ